MASEGRPQSSDGEKPRTPQATGHEPRAGGGEGSLTSGGAADECRGARPRRYRWLRDAPRTRHPPLSRGLGYACESATFQRRGASVSRSKAPRRVCALSACHRRCACFLGTPTVCGRLEFPHQPSARHMTRRRSPHPKSHRPSVAAAARRDQARGEAGRGGGEAEPRAAGPPPPPPSPPVAPSVCVAAAARAVHGPGPACQDGRRPRWRVDAKQGPPAPHLRHECPRRAAATAASDGGKGNRRGQ